MPSTMSIPIMDGSPVAVDDLVYDVTNGAGSVIQLFTDGRFVVRFAGINRDMTYTAGGVGNRFNVRTLYWKNPIIAIPGKDDTGWQRIGDICRAVVQVMKAA